MSLFNYFADANEGANPGSVEQLKEIFKNPILYIVLGALVLLIIVVYILRRFIKAKPNAVTIVLRRGKVYKTLDENNPKCFLVPFLDRVGAVIANDEKEFSSDKLFINNGPDALYKINYTLKFRILDPIKFYPFMDELNDGLPLLLNDELRLFADRGNALVLVKDYRSNMVEILKIINAAVKEYQIEATSFKINFIEPMGK